MSAVIGRSRRSATVPRRWTGLRRLTPGLIDLVVLGVLLLVAMAGLGPVFGGRRWLVAAAVGIITGLLLSSVGARFRLPGWALILLLVPVYFLFGGVLALPAGLVGGVLPDLTTLKQLGSLSFTAWRDLVTFHPPVGTASGLLTVPLMLGLGGGLAAGTAALRTRRSWLGLLPVGAILVATIVLGTHTLTRPTWQAVILVIVAALWTAWRRSWTRGAELTAIQNPNPARAAISLVLLLIASLGATIGIAQAMDRPDDREILRDHVEPPFDIRDYPSPLLDYRHYSKTLRENAVMRVTGLPAGGRIRIATMDTWDGVNWKVTGGPDVPEGSGTFTRVGEEVGQVDGAEIPGESRTVRIKLEQYDAPWLPVPGVVQRFDFSRGTATLNQLYLNPRTATGVVRSGLAGEDYEVTALVPTPRTPGSAITAEPSRVLLPPIEYDSEGLEDLSKKLTGNAATPGERAVALETGLREGYYSDDIEKHEPSQVGHGADRIEKMTEPNGLLGNSEQYASLMAVMARRQELPARVVMGFWADPERHPGGSSEVTFTGQDVQAWVEIRFDGIGWVAFDPTPPSTRTQTDPEQDTVPRPDPPVEAAPPPPQEPDSDPPKSNLDPQPDPNEDDEDTDEDEQGSALPLYWAAGSGLLLLPFVLIIAAKVMRRRRRARRGTASDRVANGWLEVVDAAQDLRLSRRGRGTRQEFVAATAPDDAELLMLARRADAGVFGPGDPTSDDITSFWSDVNATRKRLGARVSPWRRLAALFSLRSFRRRRYDGAPQSAQRARRSGTLGPEVS